MLAPRLGPMIGKGDLDPHDYHSTHPQAPIPKHDVPLLPPSGKLEAEDDSRGQGGSRLV